MQCRTVRSQRGLSLDELGRRTDIERSRLSRFERGYLSLTAAELDRLAAELGVTVEALMSRPPDNVA